MWWRSWLVCACLLLGGCAAPGGKVASPDLDTDVTVGVKYEKEVAVSNDGDSVAEGQGDASTGGGVGKIGGDGDSVALWIAIVVLGLLVLAAYPAQRSLRLAWNSWRGESSSRSGKGKDLCIKLSEWDSSS